MHDLVESPPTTAIELGSLPEPHRLTPEEALKMSRRVRSTLRPGLLAELARRCRAGAAPSRESGIEAIEARIDALDAYGLALDQRILGTRPPAPAQLRTPIFTEVRQSGFEHVEAVAELFFSAESLTNIHGPVMLFHLATLAERLMHPGESIVGIRKTAFRRLVVHRMRLHVADASRPLPPNIAMLEPQAAVTGIFVLSGGRRLLFLGFELPDRPVDGFANFNTFALALLPPSVAKTRVGDTYYVDLATRVPESTVPVPGMTPGLALMSSLDILLVMLLTLPFEGRSKLLLRIAELNVLADPVRQLTGGVRLEVRMDKVRRLGDGLRIHSGGFRFFPLEDAFSEVRIGISDEPYYRLHATQPPPRDDAAPPGQMASKSV